MKSDLKNSATNDSCKVCVDERNLCSTHEKFVRAKEASLILNVSQSTLYKYRGDGMINSVKIVRPNKKKGVVLWPRSEIYGLLNGTCSGAEN